MNGSNIALPFHKKNILISLHTSIHSASITTNTYRWQTPLTPFLLQMSGE
jgi:hypothetical protein